MRTCLPTLIASIALLPVALAEEIPAKDLLGLYATGSEISGFTATKVYFSQDTNGRISFEMVFRSDVSSPDDIKQDVINGEATLVAGVLVMARPFGAYIDKKPVLFAAIDEYHPVKIKDTIVLMRKDAYRSWSTNKSVYDYGILVQVRKTLAGESIETATVPPFKMADLFGVEHWKDPFVNGPNQPTK